MIENVEALPFCDYVVIDSATGFMHWLDEKGRVFSERSAYLFATKSTNETGVVFSVFGRVDFKKGNE